MIYPSIVNTYMFLFFVAMAYSTVYHPLSCYKSCMYVYTYIHYITLHCITLHNITYIHILRLCQWILYYDFPHIVIASIVYIVYCICCTYKYVMNTAVILYITYVFQYMYVYIYTDTIEFVFTIVWYPPAN